MNGKYYEISKRYPRFLTKAVTLSYDDGRDFDRKMIEILNEYGIKCTFNLNSGKLDSSSRFVTSAEVRELYSGHEVACHTVNHPHLNNLDNAGIVYEVIKDREYFEDIMQQSVRGFAYPYGLCETEGMIDSIKSCGIKYARTTVSTRNFDLPCDLLRLKPTCHQVDSKLYELIDRFFEPDDTARPWRIKPKLFYIWGHSYEYENNWEALEKMCKALSGHDDVWYATNIEIIDYITAFDMLVRSANGKYVYNPTDKDLYAVVNNKEIVFEAGKSYVLE